MGLAGEDLPGQNDRAQWPLLRARFAEVFRTKTRDQWCALLEGTDACFAPVLTFNEARSYPHHVARNSFVDDRPEVAISPRLSRTAGDPHAPSPAYPGADTERVLTEYGFSASEIAQLHDRGAIL